MPTGHDGEPLGGVRYATGAPTGERLAALPEPTSRSLGDLVLDAPSVGATLIVTVGTAERGSAPIDAAPAWLATTTSGSSPGARGSVRGSSPST